MAWSDVILHDRLTLFFPDHAAAEPLGSAESRLKITDLHCARIS